MSSKTQLACFFDVHEKESISPSELIDHLRNGTISSKGSFVFKKDHKYVVLRNRDNSAILYLMVYDHSDKELSVLIEYAYCQCENHPYDLIGFGTFALMKMKKKDALILIYQNDIYGKVRSHYLDALHDDVRQELADLFDIQVQIQFDFRAVSLPSRQTCETTI